MRIRQLVGLFASAMPAIGQLPRWDAVHAWPVASQGAMVYDEARQRAVWFSCYGSSHFTGNIASANDTWEWDGASWQYRASGGAYWYTGRPVAYDAAHRKVVAYGGLAAGGYTGDTWLWDGATWTRPPVGSAPSVRHAAAMAYDAARQRVVLFGGQNSNTTFAETWLWDGTTWSQAAGPAPSGRSNAAMAYDEVRARIVMFGGLAGGIHSDTWEWDGAAWQSRTTALSPPPRFDHAMAFDRTRGRVVLAGGRVGGAGGGWTDVWEWDGATWSNQLPAIPEAFWTPNLVFDAAAGRLLLHGRAGTSTLTNLWTLGGGGWQLLDSREAPFQPDSFACARDVASGSILCVLRTGVLPPRFAMFEQSGLTWIERHPPTLPTDLSVEAVTDLARGRIVCVGSGSNPTPGTWEWVGSDWIRAANSPPGGARAIAYDLFRQRTVLFGGTMGGPNGDSNDTWDWDGATWHQLQPAHRPSARNNHAMATDFAHGKVVLFGGNNYITALADTWLWDGTDWTQASSPTVPPARSAHAMAFDSRLGGVMMQGGRSLGTPVAADTWLWDGAKWAVQALAVPAGPRYGHRLVDDETRLRMLLIQGYPAPLELRALKTYVAAATTIGTGCGGTSVPRLGSDLPYHGNSAWRLELTTLPQSPCLFAVSLAPQSLSLGNGCTQYVDQPLLLPLAITNSFGVAHAGIAVPEWVALRGFVLHAQAGVLDPQGPLGGIALSNGRRLVVGD